MDVGCSILLYHSETSYNDTGSKGHLRFFTKDGSPGLIFYSANSLCKGHSS